MEQLSITESLLVLRFDYFYDRNVIKEKIIVKNYRFTISNYSKPNLANHDIYNCITCEMLIEDLQILA